MKKHFTVLILLFMFSSVSAQTLLNAGFESWPPGCPYNTPPDHWTNFTTQPGLGPDQAGCTGAIVSHEGSSHMNLVWSSVTSLLEGARQTITGLTPNSIYKINFYAVNDQAMYSYADPVKLDVFLDTTVVFTTPEMISGGDWVMYSVSFTATADTQSLAFRVREGSSGLAGSVGVDDVTFDNITGTEEAGRLAITVYPNPFNDFITMHLGDEGAVNIEICDVLGRSIYKEMETSGFSKTIRLHAIPKGIYFLTACTASEKFVFKLVKG